MAKLQNEDSEDELEDPNDRVELTFRRDIAVAVVKSVRL
jgi:hypothetical protein